jgi:hypothetical protein
MTPRFRLKISELSKYREVASAVWKTVLNTLIRIYLNRMKRINARKIFRNVIRSFPSETLKIILLIRKSISEQEEI